MSAYSTIYITRSKARIYIIEEIMKCDSNKLESIMDGLLEDKLYNCKIVNEYEANNDDLI